MKNLKLSIRLIGGFVIVAVLLVVVGMVGFTGVRVSTDSLNEMTDVRLPAMESLLGLKETMASLNASERTLLYPGLGEIGMVKEQANLEVALARWKELETAYSGLPKDEEEKDRWDGLLKIWGQYQGGIRDYLDVIKRLQKNGVTNPDAVAVNLLKGKTQYLEWTFKAGFLLAGGEDFDTSLKPEDTQLHKWASGFRSQNEVLSALVKNLPSQQIIYHQALDGFKESVENKDLDAARIIYLEELAPAAQALFANLAQIERFIKTGRQLTARMSQIVISEASGSRQLMNTFLNGMTRLNADKASETTGQALSQAKISGTTNLWVVGIGFVLAVLLGVWLSRSVVGPVGKAVDLAKAVRAGDLTKRLDMNQKDEIGQMAQSLDAMADDLEARAELALAIADGNLTHNVQLASENDTLGRALQIMNQRLNEVVSQIRESAGQVSMGTNEINTSASSLSQGATEQASSLEHISEALMEIGQQTKGNADSANQADEISTKTSQAAESGNRHMNEMVEAMREISESGNSIAKIIKVIDGIAFQTNLLALNAAVEAARAGQHGKGFAVVAEEVRNLAGRSAKAAKETSELIAGSVKKTENGMAIANRTAGALEEINQSIANVSDLVSEIAEASTEQAHRISIVNDGLEQVGKVTEQNTANAEETAAACQELSSQASGLRELLEQFRLEGDEPEPDEEEEGEDGEAGEGEDERATDKQEQAASA